MRRRGKIILAVVVILLVILIVSGTILIASYINDQNKGMKIQKLAGNDVSLRKVSDYSNSRLKLESNGTFVIYINYKDTKVFTAIGTYKKNKSSYSFTYVDVWFQIGPDFVRDGATTPTPVFIGNTKTYLIKSSRIEFLDQNSQYYYFK